MATRAAFEKDLRRLQDEVLVLGSMVGGGIVESVEILKRRDMEGSRRLVTWDERVNAKRFDIETNSLTLIATQQPMAGDLRVIAAILEIITDLERIGDYAKGIAKINLRIGQETLVKSLEDIPTMASIASEMLSNALDAFVQRDAAAARAIAARDDEVDVLYNRIYRDLIEMIIQNSTITDQATLLLWAAHNIERTADRVVNICERVIFLVTGEMKELNQSSLIGELDTKVPTNSA